MDINKVIYALFYVKGFFPQITTVIYNKQGMWLYMDDNFNTPNFDDFDIDINVLEFASDSVTELPFIYQL